MEREKAVPSFFNFLGILPVTASGRQDQQLPLQPGKTAFGPGRIAQAADIMLQHPVR